MITSQNKVGSHIQLADKKDKLDLSSYPIDMSLLLTQPHGTFDNLGAPRRINLQDSDPTMIAYCALAHWNSYLATYIEKDRSVFLAEAYWLVEHEVHIREDVSGWLISSPYSALHAQRPCLSALTQGCVLSVLTRAFQLTQNAIFLDVARRAVRTFERDILDGGICAPVCGDGVFFQEVAVYPAAHKLSGFIFALFGLYDYVALTGDLHSEKIIQHGLRTLHSLLDEFDAGFWTRSDLLHRHLSSASELALQVMLLETLARISGCEHCAALASRWLRYQHRFGSRLRYLLTDCWNFFKRALSGWVQTALFPKPRASARLRICVLVPSFPTMGGVLTFLEKVALVTANTWQCEYLTQHVGPQSVATNSSPQRCIPCPPGRTASSAAHSGEMQGEDYTIHRFGTRRMTPWYFPFIWLYVLSGFRKLIWLMHSGADYQVILAQDGVFTGAFAALAAKLAGVRVVCIDHGDISLFISRNSHIYRAERIAALATRPWPVRFVARQLLPLYWPSRKLLARIAARLVDHYLIPGVSADGVDEMCRRLGVPRSRITRFANMLEMARHVIPDGLLRANTREQYGIAADAIVIAIVCRLAPEKGLEIALEAISQAQSALPADLRARVRVLIVGDGPIRQQVEEDIDRFGLKQMCTLWGEALMEEVIAILGISDIFLYTSWRGAGYPLAIMEAMASGCAVIASTEPLANEHMLADGRGVVVPVGDTKQTSEALVCLVSDLQCCRRMGRLARDYITVHHSPAMFRRTLERVTYWCALDDLLAAAKIETVGSESGSRP